MKPTENQIRIQNLVKRFRFVHKDDAKSISALEHILWYSYPVVYPDAFDEVGSSLRDAQRIIDARKRKKSRYNKRLHEMAQCYDVLHFVTLTFSDEVLESTSERTRHRYVQQWLFENCRDYIANEDFGKQTGRHHFHAVVAFPKNLASVQPWKYGFYKFKLVRMSDDRATYRLSGYLLKLVNHSGKIGTGKSFTKRGLKDIDNLPF